MVLKNDLYSSTKVRLFSSSSWAAEEAVKSLHICQYALYSKSFPCLALDWENSSMWVKEEYVGFIIKVSLMSTGGTENGEA